MASATVAVGLCVGTTAVAYQQGRRSQASQRRAAAGGSPAEHAEAGYQEGDDTLPRGEPHSLPVASSNQADADLIKGELRLYDTQLLAYPVSHDMAHLADCLVNQLGHDSPSGQFVVAADLFVRREAREDKGQIVQARWDVPVERVATTGSQDRDTVLTCFRRSFHLKDCAWGFPGLAVTGKACLQMAIAVSPFGGLSLASYSWDSSPTCLATH